VPLDERRASLNPLSPPRESRMQSNVRIFWIIWCAFWALFWLLAGFFTFAFGWILVPLSLFAILIPVGQGPTPSGLPKQGWYQDPANPQGLRWWDGQRWTTETAGQPGRRVDSNADSPRPWPTWAEAHAPSGPSEPRPTNAAPGWYPDPWGVGTRWWNGTNWTPMTNR
jgi:hypothetical protein